MQARRPDSKIWTSLPEEYLKQIKGVITEAHQAQIGPESQFIVEGRIYKNEILLRLGYIEKDRLKQINFEASLDYKKDKENILQIIYSAVDSLDSMLSQHLSQEKIDFPLTWKSFQLDKKEIFLRYTTVNSSIEEKADDLLGPNSEGLIQGKESEEDELEHEKTAIKARLDLLDEES